jgi:hypothetical protein
MAMAFHFRCVNCGHEQEAHDPNLVNEPAEGDYEGIEVPQDGYPMSILECMETDWSSEYTKRIKGLYWGENDHWYGTGYVSPAPEKESAEYRALPVSIQTSMLIVFDPKRGYSVAIPID